MTAAKISFAGRVAVITGAGGGLGREYALEFARRGAKVVVNDLGGTFHGEGKGKQLADQVVQEIIREGGYAVANYDSVENGESIINTAIEKFGRIDILVNNAGILRDRSFVKITEEDWEKVLKVHLDGSFKVTKAAWPYMRKNKFGRVIMTTSPAGLYGNFGQTNYSAAKMGLVGLAKTLSLEGKKYNIGVNIIAPVAETRMTKDVMPEVGLLPVDIMPFVVYMCHDNCTETGIIIETAGGFAACTKLERFGNIQLKQYVGDKVTVEAVADSWHRIITNTSDVGLAGGIANKALESIQNLPQQPILPSMPVDERIKLLSPPKITTLVTSNDVILYALGIGATVKEDIRYLYEGHEDFSTFPTFAAVLGMGQLIDVLMKFPEINLGSALHGEQYTEIFAPFPTHGKIGITVKVVDILDKKRFCQMIVENALFNEDGEKIARNQMVVLLMGTSGIGKRGKSDKQVPTLPPPNRPPDAVYEETTSANQAALYRLSGDKNPLHIDQEFANSFGFKEPILHGLSSFGFSVRHILKTYAGNDASMFKSVKAQFSKPVLPGQTLVTEMWCEDQRIHFQTILKETGNVVIKGGYVDLTSKPKILKQKL